VIPRLEQVARPDGVALDPDREIRSEADCLPCTAGVRRVTVGVDRPPFCRHAAVIERLRADELELDAALEAVNRADQKMLGIEIRGWSGVRGDLVLVVARALVSASRTRTQPEGVLQVVTRTFVPGSYARAVGSLIPNGPKRNIPASRSSRLPNTLAASKRGTHSQSIDPSGATRAPV
jgi:hypothetical protein